MRLGSSFNILFLIIFLAACSDVKLTRNVQTPASLSSLSGTFCSAAADSNGTNLNIIFVIDMSGSNIEGTPAYPPLPTDYNENSPDSRFGAVANFPNLPCVAGKTNVQFAAVGFSKLVLPSNSCTASLFGNASQLTSEVNALRSIQTSEKGNLDSTGTNTGVTMKDTSYQEGFNCANSIIQSHLATLNDAQKENNAYLVYFLTDGAPTDEPTIPQEENLIGPIIDQMVNNGNAAGGIKVQPILYGEDELSSQELSDANDILGYIAGKGGSQEITIEKVADTDLCAVVNSGKKQSYVVANFGVANLTALMKQERLIPDSDMDGIPDEDEASQGFDPTLPRSGAQGGNLLLDGMCPKGVPASQCTGYTACSKPNALGFSDCDAGAYSLTDGLDSNKNLIPDNIEFLKGVSPNVDQSLTDLDGDGMLLWQELAIGRDPNFFDTGIDPSLLIQYDHQMLSTPLPGCDPNQQSWSYNVKNLPLVPTLATAPTDSVSASASFYSHRANENVIFIYYFIKKANDNPNLPTPPTLFGRYVKVSYPSGEVLTADPFVQMGSANGIFAAGP